MEGGTAPGIWVGAGAQAGLQVGLLAGVMLSDGGQSGVVRVRYCAACEWHKGLACGD